MSGLLRIDNAEIFYRNFAGKEYRYNKLGVRNFCVFIPEEIADDMKAEGWNVKGMPDRDDDTVLRPYIAVNVNFDERPGMMPLKVYVTDGDRRIAISAENVKCLDWLECKQIDLTIKGSKWGDGVGKRGIDYGIKGYLRRMKIQLHQDDFDDIMEVVDVD